MPQIWPPTHVPFDIFSRKRAANFQFPNFISKILLRLLCLICLDFFFFFLNNRFALRILNRRGKGDAEDAAAGSRVLVKLVREASQKAVIGRCLSSGTISEAYKYTGYL